MEMSSVPRARHPRFWDCHQSLVRALAALALLSGAGYLLWRLLDTGSGTSPVLYWLLLFAEIVGWWSLLLETIVTWDCRHEDPRRSDDGPTVDLLVASFDEPLDQIRATLVGCTLVEGQHRTILVDDADRAEVRELATELGVSYLTRPGDEGARAGAVDHGLRFSDADLVAVLGADQVPMPDLIVSTRGYFDDRRVALVQTPIEFSNRDSLLHSHRGHERDHANQVLGPGRDHLGGTIWEGSGSLLRREAILAVGGIATMPTTGDLATTVELQSRGWMIRHHPRPVVQGLAPHDLASYLAQRGRWARGHVATLRTPQSPLTARGLTPGQRVVHVHLLNGYLRSVTDLVLFVVLIATLWTGRLPLTASLTALAMVWLPWAVLRSLALVALSRGRLRPGENATRRMINLEMHLRALVAGLAGSTRRFAPRPEHGRDRGGLDVIGQLKLLTAMTLVLEVVLSARLLDALLGWPLAPMRGLALVGTTLVGGVTLWMALEVLGVFVRRRQHRASYRVPITLPARLDGETVKLRDLTQGGVALVTSRPLSRGTEFVVDVDIPRLRGGTSALRLVLQVTNLTPNRDHSLFRLGCRIIDAGPDGPAVLAEFVSVVVPYVRLRLASESGGAQLQSSSRESS
ncbi:MAG TPA: glycosyltransferase [Acidimicrobiales bacterium]|nr:glycosyltransferase [Acidimicrobiales bacterium]